MISPGSDHINICINDAVPEVCELMKSVDDAELGGILGTEEGGEVT